MHMASHLLHEYGLLFVFAAVLAEQLGLPLPCWPLLMAAGALAASLVHLAGLVAVATAAAIIADLIWYGASVRLGHKIAERVYRLMPSPENCKQRTETTFARLGPWTLPFAKFVPVAGAAAIALSGTTRMPMGRFLAFDAAGALLYVALPIAMGAMSAPQ